MGLTATYDAPVATVHLVGTVWGATVASVTVQRFDTAVLTNPQTVRGGVSVPMATGQTLRLDDREFTPDVLNTYRVTAYTAGGVAVPASTYTATVTPTLTSVWLRSPTRPFLDQPVTVTDFSEVSRPARGQVFEVLGRRLPVAVTEVRGSRRFDLVLRAANTDAVEALALFVSFGDTVHLHTPAGCLVPSSGHFHVGDVSERRPPKHDAQARYFTLPLVEVDGPDPTIVGSTVTWAGVVSAYATWADVVAAKVTWLALLQSISAPADEVVG